jgi:hypothetical protein
MPEIIQHARHVFEDTQNFPNQNFQNFPTSQIFSLHVSTGIKT